MKLISLLENVKPKLLKLQDWLLDKGWDDVELQHVSDTEYKLTLSHGHNKLFQRCFWCDVKDGEIEHWYTSHKVNGALPRPTFDEREMLDTAIGELAYIEVRHILKVKFLEKPGTFAEVLGYHKMPYSKLKPLIDEGVLKVYNGKDLYGFGGNIRPFAPMTSHDRISTDPIFVIEFGTDKHDMYLVDSTGAKLYYREWAAVDHEA